MGAFDHNIAPHARESSQKSSRDFARPCSSEPSVEGRGAQTGLVPRRASMRLRVARSATAVVMAGALCAAALSVGPIDRSTQERSSSGGLAAGVAMATNRDHALGSRAGSSGNVDRDVRSELHLRGQGGSNVAASVDSQFDANAPRNEASELPWRGLTFWGLPALDSMRVGRDGAIARDAGEIRLYNGRPIRPVRIERMQVTAYSPDERSCGASADGITASGYSVSTNGGFLVAADPKVLPLGSLVSVPGYDGGGVVPVLDVGGAIKGARLDVLFPTHEQAMRWGVQTLDITVWEYADGRPNDFKRFRRPSRQ